MNDKISKLTAIKSLIKSIVSKSYELDKLKYVRDGEVQRKLT